jgi:hypothetical protein
MKWTRGLSLRVPTKFQDKIDDEPIDEEANREYIEARALREELDQLFVDQSAQIDYLPDDDDPEHPDIKFLGGLIKTGEPNGYASIDIVRWVDDDELNVTSITVDSDQYLVKGTEAVFAESQDTELSYGDIRVLRFWVKPGSVIWAKGLSTRLVDHQLKIQETWR